MRALHTQRRSRLRGRRPVPAQPGEAGPEPVAITRATVIPAEPFADSEQAAEWLRRCRSRDSATEELALALALVNDAVTAHRVAAHDPHVRNIRPADVQRVRIGYGTGDEILEGSWREAYVIPPDRATRQARRRMLSPQEEMAGMLSGRRPGARPSEELLLRARLDLDHGREVEAALVTRAAVEALVAEGHGGDHSGAAGRLAGAALAGGLSPAQLEELEELVGVLEREVRRRRYAD